MITNQMMKQPIRQAYNVKVRHGAEDADLD